MRTVYRQSGCSTVLHFFQKRPTRTLNDSGGRRKRLSNLYEIAVLDHILPANNKYAQQQREQPPRSARAITVELISARNLKSRLYYNNSDKKKANFNQMNAQALVETIEETQVACRGREAETYKVAKANKLTL